MYSEQFHHELITNSEFYFEQLLQFCDKHPNISTQFLPFCNKLLKLERSQIIINYISEPTKERIDTEREEQLREYPTNKIIPITIFLFKEKIIFISKQYEYTFTDQLVWFFYPISELIQKLYTYFYTFYKLYYLQSDIRYKDGYITPVHVKAIQKRAKILKKRRKY